MKVLITVLNNREVLLSECYDPVQEAHFFIPVGGGVEFGESLRDAALRELAEEVAIVDHDLEFGRFYESRFVYNGNREHEIMFNWFCVINDQTREGLAPYGIESNCEKIITKWFGKSELEAIEDCMVPPELFLDIMKRLEVA